MSSEWIPLRKVVIEALEDNGESGMNLYTLAERWAKEAVRKLGCVPEYFIQAKEAEIDCGEILKPDGLVSTRMVWLCRNNHVIQAAYGGKGPSYLWDPDGCCRLYRNTFEMDGYTIERGGGLAKGGYYSEMSPQPIAVIGEDFDRFFFMAGDPNGFDKAIIEYNGWHTDRNGDMLILHHYEGAVKQYVGYKLSYRDRKKNRKNVPQSEVSFDWQVFLQEAGVGYGKAKTMPRPVMGEWALQKYGIRLQGIPKSREP